jgi:hypothetical protein
MDPLHAPQSQLALYLNVLAFSDFILFKSSDVLDTLAPSITNIIYTAFNTASPYGQRRQLINEHIRQLFGLLGNHYEELKDNIAAYYAGIIPRIESLSSTSMHSTHLIAVSK